LILVVLLLAFYLGLHATAAMTGAIAPLSQTGLMVIHSFNVIIVFAMASYTARFYYRTVRRAERKLVELATQDSLTGLSNRRNLLALAEQEIARSRRSGEPIALILADIDHFKQINDRRGHEAGDQVICQAGTLLQRMCRAQDSVARWGGEEFLVLLPATRIEAAAALADRMCKAVAGTPVDLARDRIAITFSFGVAELKPGEPISDAIARADRALYQSKAQGRNRVTTAAKEIPAV
jgi:diguanylate cyclase